jgi:acyl-CoA thioesterase-1
MPIDLEKGARILFQGDSITDAGRGKPPGLGTGYARIAADILLSRMPELGLTVMNRGISGHRAKDLVGRWGRDCIELKPDVVSIMIGINDTWRAFDSGDPTSADDFEASYRTILVRTQTELGAKIVMVEPFVLECPPDRVAWRADLDPKIAAVRRLAREFADVYVPLDGIFAEACTRVTPEYWAADGVHPTGAGHAFIALEWLKAVVGFGA